jgi:hypothetical protein
MVPLLSIKDSRNIRIPDGREWTPKRLQRCSVVALIVIALLIAHAGGELAAQTRTTPRSILVTGAGPGLGFRQPTGHRDALDGPVRRCSIAGGLRRGHAQTGK